MDKWEDLKKSIMRTEMWFGKGGDVYKKGFYSALGCVLQMMDNLDELEKVMEGENEDFANQGH